MRVKQLGVEDPIDPKIAEILSELAPGAEQGHVDIIGHGDRTNGPVRTMAAFVDVRDGYFASRTNRAA
jgi:hypothetical protein